MSQLAIGLFWLLHWLPLSVLSRIGEVFGLLLYLVVVPRRRVALTNLRLCFPELSVTERRALARRERGNVQYPGEPGGLVQIGHVAMRDHARADPQNVEQQERVDQHAEGSHARQRYGGHHPVHDGGASAPYSAHLG